jgi:hypothetical protein
VTRFGTKLWSVMCEKQREREHESGTCWVEKLIILFYLFYFIYF